MRLGISSRASSTRLASVVSCAGLAVVVSCTAFSDAVTGGARSGGGGDDAATTVGGDGSVVGSSGSNGGTSGSSGSSSGCSGSAADPAAATTVSGYMDKLPYAPSGSVRAAIIDAIIKSCAVFGGQSAKDPGWEPKYCWAHLVAAIDKESGYDPSSKVDDSYGARTTPSGRANDPTVGLTQIRFSSTVKDFVDRGKTEALTCVGCPLPADFYNHQAEDGDSAFWAVSGPTQNLAVMTSVACNVGLGAWYYYLNATGNGSPGSATYLADYCAGKGTAANLVTGLRSHLEGPDSGKGVIPNQAAVDALQGTDNGAYRYITAIKSQLDASVGTVGGTHPLFLKLSPDPAQYCR